MWISFLRIKEWNILSVVSLKKNILPKKLSKITLGHPEGLKVQLKDRALYLVFFWIQSLEQKQTNKNWNAYSMLHIALKYHKPVVTETATNTFKYIEVSDSSLMRSLPHVTIFFTNSTIPSQFSVPSAEYWRRQKCKTSLPSEKQKLVAFFSFILKPHCISYFCRWAHLAHIMLFWKEQATDYQQQRTD